MEAKKYQSPLGGEWGLMPEKGGGLSCIRVSIPFGWGVGANLANFRVSDFRFVSIPFGWGVGANTKRRIPVAAVLEYQSPLGGEWGLMRYFRVGRAGRSCINPLWVGSGG